MKVKIQETGEIKELSIQDKRNIDWTLDLIGNAGALYHGRGSKEGKFNWSEENDSYLATQETYDWWDKYISDYEQTEQEIEALAEKLGIDEWIIKERIGEYMDSDYDVHRRAAISAMQEIEEEYHVDS